MKKLLRTISIVLIIANLLTIPFSSYAASGTTTITSDSTLLSKWKGYGLLDESMTNSDLSEPITKIDFIRYINSLLKLSKQVDIGFSDVPKDSWYGAEIAKAVAAGYVSNQDKTSYNPFSNITRLDAAIMVAHVFELELKNKNSTNSITDAEKLDTAQLASLGAVIEKGYLSEISSGRYAPLGVLKLIDAIQMLDKCFGQLVTKSGKITSDVQGNMLINTNLVTLENITVNGDLIIGEGVDDGEVRLENTILKGRLIVRGGGPNSVVLVNTQVNDDLIVEKSAGDVHVELFGKSAIEQTYLKSGCLLSEENLSGKGFVNVTADQAVIDNQTAKLQGDFNNIVVDGSNINIKLNGNAQNINISKDTKGSFSINGNVGTIATQASQNTLELLGGTISKLNVETGAKGNKITINGAKTNAVNIAAINLKENTAVNIDKGTVEELTLESSAEGSNLELKTGGILKNFYAKASATITGKGQIGNAYVYSQNVSMGIKPSGKYLTDNSATDTDGTVADSNPSLIKVYGKDITLQVGKTEKVTAYVVPTSSTLSYSAADGTIATVDDKGMLTANSVGTTLVYINAQKEGYIPNVATINVTVTSDNITVPGTLVIDPTTGETGTYRDFTLTYIVGDNMLNGKVYIRLPAGFIALESDTVKIGDLTERALGSSWQKPDTLLFENLKLTAGQKIIVKLVNKEVPAGGQYEFSSTSDADGDGPKLSTTDEKAIFISDSLKKLKVTTNYSVPEYGSIGGTTKISTLSFNGLGDYITEGYKWLIKVQDGELTTVPKFNDELPISAAAYSVYEQGKDIPVIAGQHLILAAVDASNKIKAYADILITDGTNGSAKMIRPDDAAELVAGTNYNIPEQGIMAGTTRIGGLNYAGADHWMIRLQDTAESSIFVNTEFKGATDSDYTNDEDIKVTENQHIVLAAVDKDNRIKAYKDITVNPEMISEPAGTLVAGSHYEAPSIGSDEGTTKLGWLNKGITTDAFTDVNKWMIVVLDEAAVIPALDVSTTEFTKYTDGMTFENYFAGANIPVTDKQHILLVGVNENVDSITGKTTELIKAYADIAVGTNVIRQTDAVEIPAENLVLPTVIGSKAGSTQIIKLDFTKAIPQATKYMVKAENNSEVFTVPQMNSKLDGSVDCSANMDITVASGQYLILVATDANGFIKAYKVVDESNLKARPKDTTKLETSLNDYSTPKPGSEEGSTMIELSSNGIPREDSDTREFGSWMYMVKNGQFTIPYDGSDIPTGMQPYNSGADIKVTAGQYVMIIAIDKAGKVMAYTQEQINAQQIKQPKTSTLDENNYSTPVPGVTDGTTRIMTLKFSGITGNNLKWLYKVSANGLADPGYDSVVSGTIYSAGVSIPIEKDQYITLYAVDMVDGFYKVKAYTNLKITEGQIKVSVKPLSMGPSYSKPSMGNAAGYTQITSLSFAEFTNPGSDWSWKYAVGNTSFIAPSKNTTLSTYIDSIGVTAEVTTPQPLNPAGTITQIKASARQYLLLVVVDGSDVIQGYASVDLDGYVKPEEALKIPDSSINLVKGTVEGTTSFDKLNAIGIIGQEKWMVIVQKDPFNTATNPIALNSTYTNANYTNYKANTNITISQDWYMLLLATDNAGRVKAYKELQVGKDKIMNPFANKLEEFTNYTGPVPGATDGTTRITLMATNIPTDSGTISWMYKVGKTDFAIPHLDDLASTPEYTSYSTSGAAITAAVGDRLLIVAVGGGKIKAYKQFTLEPGQVKPTTAKKLVLNKNYFTPVPGTKPGTTKIGGLDMIGLPTGVSKWQVKVVDIAEDLVMGSMFTNPLPLLSSSDTMDNIPAKDGQTVVLAAVDTNGHVKAFENILVDDKMINPPLATGDIKYSTPKYGSVEGMTSIYLSKEGISRISKFMLKLVSSPQDIVAGQTITEETTTAENDYSKFKSYDESAGKDIKASVGQYLLIVAVDSSNKALVYTNVKLISSYIRPGDATLLTAPKNYHDLEPGSDVGTTLISYLDAFDIPGFSKWVVKVESSTPSKPPLMDSSVQDAQDYTVNMKIKVSQGDIFELYALDANMGVKGYAFITVKPEDVKGVATKLNLTPVPGTTLNTTMLTAAMLKTALDNASITDVTAWKYAIMDSAPADILMDSNMKTWGAAYTPDTNIVAVEQKHLVLVATDGAGLAKAYADITLDSTMLKGINVNISGTITDPTGEADIVAGGRTIIITLVGSEWQDDVFTDPIKQKLLFTGFTPVVSDTQWKNVVAGFKIVPMSPVDKKVITIRMSETKYDISTNQQISLNIDKSLIKNADKNVTVASAFKIGADAGIKPLTGTAIVPGLTEADIEAGGKTIIVELTVGEFATDVDTDTDKRNAIFNAITSLNTDKKVRDQIVSALVAAGSKAIVWNSSSKITIILQAIPSSDFTLNTNEVLCLNIPCKTGTGKEILIGAATGASASTPIIISADVKADLGGTITSPVTENDLFDKTLTITLSKAQWVSDIATDVTKQSELFKGLAATSTVATEVTGQWSKVITALTNAVNAGQTVVTRDSDSTITIKFPSVSGYNITANQTISVNVPGALIVGGKTAIKASQTFTIQTAASAALSGFTGGKVTGVAYENDIIVGGKQIIITLKDAAWADDFNTNTDIKKALLDGIVADTDTDNAWKLVIDTLKFELGKVQKTSGNVVTIDLPAVALYSLTTVKQQILSVTIPATALKAYSFNIKASGTLTINDAIPVAAVVTNVKASESDKTYKTGDKITIYVTFDKEVAVTGKPTLGLAIGSTTKNATYTGGTGSKILTFTYTVLADDVSTVLDYKATTSLTVPAGASIINLGSTPTTAVSKTLPALGSGSSLSQSNVGIDAVAPKFATSTAVGIKNENDVSFTAKVDEDSTVYYVILPKAAVYPDANHIMDGKDSTNGAAINGNSLLTLNTDRTFTATGLSANTDYNIHMVAVDALGNASAVKTLNFITSDKTAPVFDNPPAQLLPTSDNKIDISVKINEPGKVYLVALPKGSQAPNSAQVKAFKDANNVTATYMTSASVTDKLTTVSLIGLPVSGHYDIYIVCEDTSLNLIATPAVIYDAKTSRMILTNVAVNVVQKLITNTTTAMQYSLNGYTWNDCSATNTTFTYNDSADSLAIYIREKADPSNVRAPILINRSDSALITKPVTYDIAAKKITNPNTVSATDSTVLALEYRMNSGTWKPLNAAATDVEFTYGVWYVRVAATASNLPSVEVPVTDISVPDAAPNLVYDDYMNTIKGLDSTLEYRIDGGDWTNGTVAANFAGTKKVEIRKIATKDKLASSIQTINFTACVIEIVAIPAADTTTNMNSVAITFEENTNKPALTADTFKKYFLVGKWNTAVPPTQTTINSWGNDINAITWNSTGNILTVTFKTTAMAGLTAMIGDEVRIDVGAGITKAGTTTNENYTCKGTLTGSFHTTPILSVKAVNSNGTIGFGSGDQIVITFDQLVNKNDITALTTSNIGTFLKVTDSSGIVQNWGVVNNTDIVWSKSSDNTKSILTITFKGATQIDVNDKLSINPAWGLKDADNTTAVCNFSASISGSFTSSPKINSAVYSAVNNTVIITFDQATNESRIDPVKLNEWFKLVDSDGITKHSWGINNDEIITWTSSSILKITLPTIAGRTIEVGDTLTLSTYATIKAADNGTESSSASVQIKAPTP